ncbi:MAG: hypothetical protein ACI311_03400 [Bacilli bacterium]
MNQTSKTINKESIKLFLLNYFPILIFFILTLIMIMLLNFTSLKTFLFFIITSILCILTLLSTLLIKKKNKHNNETFNKKFIKENLTNVIQIMDSNLSYLEDNYTLNDLNHFHLFNNISKISGSYYIEGQYLKNEIKIGYISITEEFKKIIKNKKRKFKIKSFSGYIIKVNLNEILIDGNLIVLPRGDLSDGLINQMFLNFNLKEMLNNDYSLDKYIFLNSNLNENKTEALPKKIKKALVKLSMQYENKLRIYINNNSLLLLVENSSFNIPLFKLINKRNTLNILNTHLQLLNIVNSFI